MLLHLLVGWTLMGTCVVIHAAGIIAALHRVRGRHPHGFWPQTWLLARLAGWMVFLHLVEISVWGLFYAAIGAIGDLTSALYFSSVTYTTTGYGDVVLPLAWRLVGGIEAMTGILMFGWSTGFFFAVFSRLVVSAPDTGDR